MDLTFLKLIEFSVLEAKSIIDNKNKLSVKDFVLIVYDYFTEVLIVC